MIVASAQFSPNHGDVEANLNWHCKMIELAAQKGARLIVFPETSLTGYELENASKMAFSLEDSRLLKFKDLAEKLNIVVIVGAPVKLDTSMFIGSIIIMPNRETLLYTKHYLHGNEVNFFSSSFDYDPLIEIDGHRVSLAICADIDNPEHAQAASQAGATLYIASIFFSKKGIGEAHKLLSGYAKKHSFSVLMSNFCGESYGIPAGGRSAFWNKDGELIKSLDGSEIGILVVV